MKRLLAMTARAAATAIIGAYLLGVMLSIPYYNWRYARDHGFLSWLFLGEIVPTIEAPLWPYFVARAALQPTTEKLEDRYFQTLDDWVARGGVVSEVQQAVVEPCGKLVLLTARAGEKVALTTTRRSEFHFRVDVCTKITVNRLYPQPQFKRVEVVNAVCDGDVGLFARLCKRSGLR
jgi:hypothetical protein